MPLVFVTLISWHVLSRVLVIIIFALHSDPMIPSPEVIELGHLLVFNGASFFVLLFLMCAPTAFGKNVSVLQRSCAVIGILLGLLSGAYDIFAGIELTQGNDFIYSNVLLPMRQNFPFLHQSIPWVFLVATMTLVTVGSAAVVIRQRRRTSRGDQHHDRDESKTLFWFPDLP